MPDEPLELGDVLAQERTAMAAERALMAVLVALLGLGLFSTALVRFELF